MISTTRLQLLPLTYAQLVVYLQGNNLLEDELHLNYTGRHVIKKIKNDVENNMLLRLKQSADDNCVFHTFWIVIDRNLKLIVAELGFKGEPDHDGCVELEYGTMPGFESNGYMTEAVAGICDWAIKQENIQCILLSIEKRNLASIRVAEKNGFKLFRTEGNMFWWRRFTNSV